MEKRARGEGALIANSNPLTPASLRSGGERECLPRRTGFQNAPRAGVELFPAFIGRGYVVLCAPFGVPPSGGSPSQMPGPRERGTPDQTVYKLWNRHCPPSSSVPEKPTASWRAIRGFITAQDCASPNPPPTASSCRSKIIASAFSASASI